MNTIIIDYGSGNLHSAAKAFERAARDNGLDHTIEVSSDPAKVAAASHIVLPGVGAFADCKRGLDDLPGMAEALQRTVTEDGRPFLGICVGAQLMARHCLEHGSHQGLGWIDADVVAIETPVGPGSAGASTGPLYRIPHMGWNGLEIRDRAHPLFDGIDDGRHVYFVHSFHIRPAQAGDLLAQVTDGAPITAAVGRDNMAGFQFHPEKSQAVGLRIIANFLRWRP